LSWANPKPRTRAGDLIKDGTEATFMADVIEGSRETPVIVDFWAPGAARARRSARCWRPP
jgi:putative thioredoxin